jgi:hypothetical protein
MYSIDSQRSKTKSKNQIDDIVLNDSNQLLFSVSVDFKGTGNVSNQPEANNLSTDKNLQTQQ